MKKLLSTLFLFCLIVSAAYAGFTERSEPYLVKHFKSTAGKELNVTTAGGHIQVIGTDARNASVALLVTDANGNYDKATIEKALKNYVITIREEKNTLVASAVRKPKTLPGTAELLISFRVNIPKKTSCVLNSNGGAIAVNNLKGNATVLTAGGAARLCQFSGVLRAASEGGAISLNEAEGTLDLRSAGGSIDLKKVAGNIEARSEGGSIQADVRELGNYLTLETNEGSLKATIPGNMGLDVELTGSQVQTDLSDFKGISETDKVSGTIYGGGIPVKLLSTSGVAVLKYRS